MLVSLDTILQEAERGSYAVVAPNFFNLYSARVLLETAEGMRAPVILSYSPRFHEFIDIPNFVTFISLVCKMISEVSVPVALHLDHGKTSDEVHEAINAGFTSVMIDGSMLSFDENIQLTRQVVEKARASNISVEAELGHVGSGDSNFGREVDDIGDLDESKMTDPARAKRFVEDTGIDALAVSVGTVHGYYQVGSPVIDFDRLQKIKDVVPVPLVLHGCSGVPKVVLKKTISLGIRKINVWSDLISEIMLTMKANLENDTAGLSDMVSAYKLSMEKVLKEYIEISGSQGVV